MTIECWITIDADKAHHFVPGEIVRGHVFIKMTEPSKLQNIDISLQTEYFVVYQLNNKAHQKLQESILTSQRIQISEKMTFSIYNTGKHECEFEMQLPYTCSVPTFNFLEGIVDFNYYVKANINDESCKKFTCKEPFRVSITERMDYHKMNVQLSIRNTKLKEGIIKLKQALRVKPPNLYPTLPDSIKVAAYLDESNIVAGCPLPLELKFYSTRSTESDKPKTIILQYIQASFIAYINLKVETHTGTNELLKSSFMTEVIPLTPYNKRLVLTCKHSRRIGTGPFSRFLPNVYRMGFEYFESHNVGKYLLPSFTSDPISLKYDLHLTVGIEICEFESPSEITLSPKIFTVEAVFKDVEIKSNLR